MSSPQYFTDKLHLNIQPNAEGVLECRGRIQGALSYLLDRRQPVHQEVRRESTATLYMG